MKGERLITTHSTIDLRRAGIPLVSMPANFRDACIATRKLGYQFLWIDSLCIIQDSKEDWEKESAKMGKIYMNAALTLAAAAAKDSDGGMFETGYEQRDFEDFEPSKWFLEDRRFLDRYAIRSDQDQQRNPAPKSCKIGLVKGQDSPKVSLTPWMPYSDLEENWFRCVVVGPLAQRGWTLQERTLSFRSIYYGNRQIYWQCPSARLAADGESLPLGSLTSVWSQGSDHSEWPDILSLRHLSWPLSPEQESRVHKLWRNILRIYIDRLLTKKSDKLPALAGMAAIIHSITGDRYLAGFWERDLLVSLLWTRMPIFAKGAAALRFVMGTPQWDLPPQDRVLEAPSWSWAGANVDGRLDFWIALEQDRLWREKDAQILGAETELAGSNPFGAVKNGRVRLKGYAYPRWDGRVEGWNPPQNGWKGVIDAGSDYSCLHSALRDVDRVVLWDYPPRHSVALLPKFLRLLAQLFFSLLALIIWQGIDLRSRIEKVHDDWCPYCVKCLNLHVSCSVDNEPRRSSKTGQGIYEVGLWALILEPVKGEKGTYRRIGISEKIVEISEEQYRKFREDRTEPPISGMFDQWNMESVTIV